MRSLYKFINSWHSQNECVYLNPGLRTRFGHKIPQKDIVQISLTVVMDISTGRLISNVCANAPPCRFISPQMRADPSHAYAHMRMRSSSVNRWRSRAVEKAPNKAGLSAELKPRCCLAAHACVCVCFDTSVLNTQSFTSPRVQGRVLQCQMTLCQQGDAKFLIQGAKNKKTASHQ